MNAFEDAREADRLIFPQIKRADTTKNEEY